MTTGWWKRQSRMAKMAIVELAVVAVALTTCAAVVGRDASNNVKRMDRCIAYWHNVDAWDFKHDRCVMDPP